MNLPLLITTEGPFITYSMGQGLTRAGFLTPNVVISGGEGRTFGVAIIEEKWMFSQVREEETY